MWDWEFRDRILGNSLPANSLSLDVFHENGDEFHGFIAALVLCIPKVAAPVFPGSEIPPEFRPKSQLLQNPAGFSLDPPCGNGGGVGIWDLFPAGIGDTCAFGQRVFHDFSWKKTSFGMCWMGGKGSGTLGIPWGWNMGWKTGMEPPTGSVNSLPAPEFHPEIPKKPQPIPNYPVAGMGWNFLPKFPGISPPNRERGAQSFIL